MEPHPWIDYRQAPLFKQLYPAHATWEQIVSFRTAVNEVVLTATGPFAWVDDFSNGLGMVADAKARHYFASEDKKLEARNKELCAGVALVVPHLATRGIVTAVYWMAPPVFPYKFFSEPAAAEVWAKWQLELRGVLIA